MILMLQMLVIKQNKKRILVLPFSKTILTKFLLVIEQLSDIAPLSALGYFVVNKSTYLSIITNSIAYLIIVYQL